MAAEVFNSQGGYSVDIPPKTVIDGNANVVTNVNYPPGNVTANAIYANVYKFANGTTIPLIPAGSNTEVIFNDQGQFNGSANFTYNKSISQLTVDGTIVTNSITTDSIVSLSIYGDNLISRTGPLTISAIGSNENITLAPTGNGVVNVSDKRIVALSDPINFTDAATKQYVDSVASGLSIKDACDAATPDSLANLTGGIVVYNNGSGGVGATLNLENPLNYVDNVPMSAGKRVLVKNEANPAYNGIYVVDTTVKLTRATDFDNPTDIKPGSFTYIGGGQVYNGTGWVETAGVIAVGVDPIAWTQFSGYTTYSAGTGLTLANTTFSISNTTVASGSYGNSTAVASFTVNPQGQLTAAANVPIVIDASKLVGTTLSSNVITSSLTTVGILTQLSVYGNISAGNVNSNFVGSGSGLTNINASNVIGVVANASYAANSGNASVANTVTYGSQPNIVSLGTLIDLTVTGNTTSGNFNTLGNVSASVFKSSATTGTAPLQISSTTLVSNLNANLLNGYTTATAATANTIVLRDANGNITGSTISGNTITANLFIGNVQGNVSGNISAGGNTGEVQFNKNGLLAGNEKLVYNDITQTLDAKTLLVANSFQLGSGIYKFSNTVIYGAITQSSDPEQELWSVSANLVSSVDFMVISSDLGASGSEVIRRQISKITSMVLGNVVDYIETSSLNVNGLTGNYAVGYDTGNNAVQLLFTPYVGGNRVQHNIQITSYYYVV